MSSGTLCQTVDKLSLYANDCILSDRAQTFVESGLYKISLWLKRDRKHPEMRRSNLAVCCYAKAKCPVQLWLCGGQHKRHHGWINVWELLKNNVTAVADKVINEVFRIDGLQEWFGFCDQSLFKPSISTVFEHRHSHISKTTNNGWRVIVSEDDEFK